MRNSVIRAHSLIADRRPPPRVGTALPTPFRPIPLSTHMLERRLTARARQTAEHQKQRQGYLHACRCEVDLRRAQDDHAAVVRLITSPPSVSTTTSSCEDWSRFMPISIDSDSKRPTKSDTKGCLPLDRHKSMHSNPRNDSGYLFS